MRRTATPPRGCAPAGGAHRSTFHARLASRQPDCNPWLAWLAHVRRVAARFLGPAPLISPDRVDDADGDTDGFGISPTVILVLCR